MKLIKLFPLFIASAALLLAQDRKNPTSKIYVADVDGEAVIDSGTTIDDLTKKSVYNAEGTVIETKDRATNSMVFSNGTGVFFEPDTRLEIKTFAQEPFIPDRTDMDTEPSVSDTQAFIPRGTIGLCTSKLVAGSDMTYKTQFSSIHIRGGKFVIQSNISNTVISDIDGNCTVNLGNEIKGGHPLIGGQQAIITKSEATIQDIPLEQRKNLDTLVYKACQGRQSVYFEIKGERNAPPAPGYTDRASAFSDMTAQMESYNQEIVVVPVVPVQLPIQYDPSPDRIK
jgi:hypothetical protein